MVMDRSNTGGEHSMMLNPCCTHETNETESTILKFKKLKQKHIFEVNLKGVTKKGLCKGRGAWKRG